MTKFEGGFPRSPNLGPMLEGWQLLTDGREFTVQNLDQLYVLVSSTHKKNRCDMTYPALKAMLKPT